MNAAQLLSSKGASMQQASDWVQARLGQPGEIYSARTKRDVAVKHTTLYAYTKKEQLIGVTVMRIVNFSEARNPLKSLMDQVTNDADYTVIARRDVIGVRFQLNPAHLHARQSPSVQAITS